MRVDDTRQILSAAQIDPSYYSFGAERHQALCLVAAGPAWLVFLSERGRHYEERVFTSEDEACVYFLQRVFRLWRLK